MMPLTFKEFAEQAKSIFNETPLDADGYSGRHSTHLTVYDETNEDYVYYDVVSVEPEITMGCGCWVGLSIKIERQDDDTKA